MSTNDSAGDKLIASINKARSSAGKHTNSGRKEPSNKSVKPVKKKTVTRKKTTTKVKTRKEQAVYIYHTGKRVWPD